MQGWDKGILIRTYIKGLILVLLLISCTLTPSSLKQQGALQTQTQRSLLPKSTSFFTGKPNAEAEKQGFRTQDYAKSTSCIPDSGGCITALNANLAWSAPAWQPHGDTITLAALQNPAASSYYGYSFAVLGTQTNAQGHTFASRVGVAVVMYYTTLNENGISYTRNAGVQNLILSSSDGLSFQLDPSVSQGSLLYNWNNPVQNGLCAAGGWGEGANLMASQASLTLNPIEKKAEMSLSFSGPIIYSYYNKEIPDHPYSCSLISNQNGSGSVDLTINFPVNFVEIDTITVLAAPSQFAPKSNTLAKVSVNPSNPSRNWTLKAKAKNIDESCSFDEQTLSSGQGKKEDIPFGAGLPDGEYDLIAEYDDANAPKEPGQTVVTASSEVGFDPKLYVVTLGTSATFAIKQPVCPKAKLTLISGTLRSTVPGSQEVTCQAEDFGTAGSQFTWDGICQGPNGDVRGIGSVQFKLEAAGKSDTATVRIEPEGTGPTGPPTPPTPPGPTNRPRKNPGEEPTDPPTTRPGCQDIPALCLECPVGSICSGKPEPPGPPPPGPPVPPEVACPPAGICPPPPACSGSNCPSPTPCPQGAICLPPPSPTPKPDGSGCAEGYIYIPKIDAHGNPQGGECDYCPKEYFGYDEDNGCYLKMFFKVEHAPNPPLGAPFNPVTFSPRDINGVADKVHFITAGDINSFPGLHYVRWDMTIASKKAPNWEGPDVFKDKEGLKTFVYDGWQSSKDCLIDGEYSLSLILQPKPYIEENPPQIYVQVPQYKYAVPTTVFIKEKDKIPFRVDNTPPVVKNLVITQQLVNAQEKQYKTHVSFSIVDPVVSESGATLPDKPSLEAGALQIFVDDAPFYTSPAVDADGFWIAANNRQLPQNLENWILTKSSPTDRQAQVSFNLPYRLAGHTLEVEVQDTLANTGRYILYPEGN